jgi:hypothetical protein
MILFRSAAILLILIGSTVLVPAQQRPLITDDVDITPQGAVNISAGVDFLQKAKFPLSGLNGDETRLADIRIKTGFASNVELQIEGSLQNYLAINSAGLSAIPLNVSGNSTHDFDDYIVSAKIKLRSESKGLPAFGFKLGFQMPNTDQAKGLGTNQINIFTKFLVQKHFGKKAGKDARANLFGNLGLAIMSAPLDSFSQNDVLLYGVAGIFRVTDHFNIASEVNGRVSTRSGPAPIGTESIGQFRIGAQFHASGLMFDTAGIFGLTRFSPRTGITFGVTYQSPPFFKPAQ